MTKTILITGATDGIGLETARMLSAAGHHLLLHGRSEAKLSAVAESLADHAGSEAGSIETYLADMADLGAVDDMAKAVLEKHSELDVLINNAGVLKTHDVTSRYGIDVRFVVNTLAPYRLTQKLKSALKPSSRVINLSSAAQAPVNPDALQGKMGLDDMAAYSQSKLAIVIWSFAMAAEDGAPIVIAVNPGSLLGTKMVKEGFGMAGHDIKIGAEILRRLALDDEFNSATGKYYDNDAGAIGAPHPDALNEASCKATMQVIDKVMADIAN